MTVSRSSKLWQKWLANMPNNPRSYISLSTFMCAGGVAGGGALTHKLAGADAAILFLKFGAFMVLALLAVQIMLTMKSQKRAIYLVLFNMAFVLGIIGFMLCLLLPLFWIPVIGFLPKLLSILVSIWLWVANLYKGIKIFESRWSSIGAKLLSRYYKREQGEIDWSGLLGEMKMSVSIYIPGVSKKFIPLMSMFIAVSMLAGLSLRNVFPKFSAFAWGVPVIVVISLIVQMIGFGVAQFMTLNALERENGAPIRPS
jgi:hypothetical protein